MLLSRIQNLYVNNNSFIHHNLIMICTLIRQSYAKSERVNRPHKSLLKTVNNFRIKKSYYMLDQNKPIPLLWPCQLSQFVNSNNLFTTSVLNYRDIRQLLWYYDDQLRPCEGRSKAWGNSSNTVGDLTIICFFCSLSNINVASKKPSLALN